MLISSLNRDMTEKRCLVQIGDRLENLLPVSEYNALHEKKSILVSNLPKKRIFSPSPERTTTTTATATTAAAAATTAASKLSNTNSLKNAVISEISIVGEFRKREESTNVVKATRPSPVATTTTEVASNSCFQSSRPSVNMISPPIEKDEKQKDSIEYPMESYSPPPLTIATPRRDDSTKNRHPIEKMKQRVTFLNGNESDKVTKKDNNDVDDDKVTTPIEKDERRVAPLIIRAPKITTPEKEVGGIQMEKIEVIRLPAKFSNRIRVPSPPPKNVDSNDSSDVDLQRQKSPSKLILEKSKTSKSIDGSIEANANKMTKKRKREFLFLFLFPFVPIERSHTRHSFGRCQFLFERQLFEKTGIFNKKIF